MSFDPNAEAAAIAATLALADPVGRVYDHQKMPTGNDWAPFLDAFSVTDADGQSRIQAWTVQYLGEDRVPRTVAMGQTRIMREVSWKVRFHLVWTDAGDSELAFRDLLVAAVTRLDEDMGLGGTAVSHDPCDISTLDGAGVMLGGFLCHYGEIAFVAHVSDTVATH